MGTGFQRFLRGERVTKGKYGTWSGFQRFLRGERVTRVSAELGVGFNIF